MDFIKRFIRRLSPDKATSMLNSEKEVRQNLSELKQKVTARDAISNKLWVLSNEQIEEASQSMRTIKGLLEMMAREEDKKDKKDEMD